MLEQRNCTPSVCPVNELPRASHDRVDEILNRRPCVCGVSKQPLERLGLSLVHLEHWDPTFPVSAAREKCFE
jgi:hypothetical protein